MMTVKEQQCFLGGLGYYDLRYKEPPREGDLAIDELPGPVLTGAIRKFQIEHRQRPNGTQLWVDGTWGPATEEALREVIGTNEAPQVEADPDPKPETVDPKPSKIPASWKEKYPYLEDINQILCQCHGRYCNGLPDDREFSEITLGWANEIGRILGVKIKCTSGYRCPQHNASIKNASPNSKHKQAIAMDIQAADHSVSSKRLYDVADKLIGDQGGVGIYSWGIHIDSRGFRSRWDSR